MTHVDSSADRPVDGPTLALTCHIEKMLAGRRTATGPFTFGVLADTHIHIYGQWHAELVRRQLQGLVDGGADFGMLVGDLGSYDAVQPLDGMPARQTEVFLEVVRSVPDCPPLFMSMGNHDLDGDGKSGWLDALFPGVVKCLNGNGNDRFIYYSFSYGGCHFVCLDAHRRIAGSDRRRPFAPPDADCYLELPDEQFDWLEHDLSGHRDELTFVFMHEPTQQVECKKPYHMLCNRGRLIGTLARHRQVKWLFHGHTHHDSQIQSWGINICNVGRGCSQVVRVDGDEAILYDVAPDGTRSRRPFDDLGGRHRAQLKREGDEYVFHIAAHGDEYFGRKDDVRGILRDAKLLAACGTVEPPGAKTMLAVDVPVDAKPAGTGQKLLGCVSTDFIVEIKEGMQFAYDVYVNPESVHDHVSLILLINTRDGRRYRRLVDQHGVAMDPERDDAFDAFDCLTAQDGSVWSPSLKGRATGRWYERRGDLGHLAGGWVVGVVAMVGPPTNEPSPAGRVRFHLSSIRLTWPVSAGPIEPSVDALPGQPAKIDAIPRRWRFMEDPQQVGVNERWFDPRTDDSTWREVDVPEHRPPGYIGEAWFRTAFTMPPAAGRDNMVLQFKGVDEEAWVYLNGKMICEHTAASTDKTVEEIWNEKFTVTVTEYRQDQPNLLAVRVRNSFGPWGIHAPVQLWRM